MGPSSKAIAMPPPPKQYRTTPVHTARVDENIQSVMKSIGNLFMAESEGFEPSERLRAQRFSRPPRSTTPATLRMFR